MFNEVGLEVWLTLKIDSCYRIDWNQNIPAGITNSMIRWGSMQQAPLAVIPAGIPASGAAA